MFSNTYSYMLNGVPFLAIKHVAQIENVLKTWNLHYGSGPCSGYLLICVQWNVALLCDMHFSVFYNAHAALWKTYQHSSNVILDNIRCISMGLEWCKLQDQLAMHYSTVLCSDDWLGISIKCLLTLMYLLTLSPVLFCPEPVMERE